MREVLEGQPELHIRQAEVVNLVIEDQGPDDAPGELPRPVRPRGRVLGLKLRDGRQLLAGATIITTGHFSTASSIAAKSAIQQAAAASLRQFFSEKRCARWVCGRAD